MKNCIRFFRLIVILLIIAASCEKSQLPKVSIIQPDDNSTFTTSDMVTFSGTATDDQDGIIPGSSLTWVSDLDDTIGTGNAISVQLSPGEHEITFFAVDADGNQNSDHISITVTGGIIAPKLEKDYSGFLHVHWVNTYPDWDVETQVAANIVGDSGVINFGTGTLSYSGVTMVSGDSKIEREGSWSLKPTGKLLGSGMSITIEVDGGITLQDDVQKIWAKDSGGNWILVNETPFSGLAPDAQLVFSLEEALTAQGSQTGISVETGSMVWTLTLIEE